LRRCKLGNHTVQQFLSSLGCLGFSGLGIGGFGHGCFGFECFSLGFGRLRFTGFGFRVFGFGGPDIGVFCFGGICLSGWGFGGSDSVAEKKYEGERENAPQKTSYIVSSGYAWFNAIVVPFWFQGRSSFWCQGCPPFWFQGCPSLAFQGCIPFWFQGCPPFLDPKSSPSLRATPAARPKHHHGNVVSFQGAYFHAAQPRQKKILT
jgi:hypothetical protein